MTAGALGVAGASGAASAHQKFGGSTAAAETREESIGDSENAAVVGYHSLGGRGTEPAGNGPADHHYGGVTEVRVRGDYAYVGLFSSRGDTGDRGLAIVDIGEYNRATTREELAEAEMEVVSFFRNLNDGTAVMDVKVSGDGEFVFLGTQPITALFNETSTTLSTELSGESTSATNTGGVVAVDVGDPANPELAGAFDAFSTGIHNLFHHSIDGTDYVFACKDIEYAGDAGLYVFAFDRSTGALTLRTRWTPPEEPAVEDAPLPFYYCHDVEVQDDPRTGTPTAYVAYWGAGVRVLDVSDPGSPEQVGHFEMEQAHFTTPAPELVRERDEQGNLVYDENGDPVKRRVLIASHEEPSDGYDDGNEAKSNPDSSGTVFLVDADDIYETATVSQLRALDDWTWLAAEEIEALRDENGGEAFANYELSPHNSDAVLHPVRLGEGRGENFERDRNGTIVEELWVHQAHYHGGVRFLRVDASDWSLVEEGYSRPDEDVPEESRMTGLSGVAPFVWGAVDSGGVTFAADINQGVFAITHDDIEVDRVESEPGRSGPSLPVGGVGGSGGLTAGTLAAIAGATYRNRDRLADRVESLFD